MGPLEWVIIGVVILLILGPTQIPKLVRTIKKTRNEIKNAMEEEDGKASKKESEDGAEKA
ncbi:MAG: twin-arginine translocase TatA/TatE family subunit [Lachnospiraceae bacterium]|nr:twin-arginine translocase TatA/TatE family subunit [Lachnospiraceae bacterium]